MNTGSYIVLRMPNLQRLILHAICFYCVCPEGLMLLSSLRKESFRLDSEASVLGRVVDGSCQNRARVHLQPPESAGASLPQQGPN